jgi:RHS repeat-associated protein
LAYRFGFNGKEDDRETGTQDYGFRIYNPQLGKFLSVDPLTKSYPMLTPYQFASNRPIQGIDLDGLEFKNANGTLTTNRPPLQLTTAERNYVRSINSSYPTMNLGANTPTGNQWDGLAQTVFNNTFGNNPEESYRSSAYSNQPSPAIRMPDGTLSAVSAEILDANGQLSPALHNELIQLQLNTAANNLATENANGMFFALSQNDINEGLLTFPSLRNAVTNVAQSGFEEAVFPGKAGGSPVFKPSLVKSGQSTVGTTANVQAWRQDQMTGNVVESRIPYMVGSGNAPAAPLMGPATAPAGAQNATPNQVTTTYQNNQNNSTPRNTRTTMQR